MDTKKWTRIAAQIGGAAVIALGLAATVPHMDAAQDQTQTQDERVGRGGRGPGMPFGRGGRMGGPMAGGFGEVMRELTEAQREQVRAIHQKHADRVAPLAERAHAAREALNTAVLGGNTANLQALSIEVGNAETELTFAQAQMQAEVAALLTAEQKQRIAERRKEMEQHRAEMMKKRQNRTQ
jgi:Spy/CpxP family protein refolding chaperone